MIQFFTNTFKNTITINKIDDMRFYIDDFIESHKDKLDKADIEKLPYILYVKPEYLHATIMDLAIYNM